MRDFRDAKTMAHALRDALQGKAVETTHSECLELIAKAFGYENWNILSAKIEVAQTRALGAPPLAPAAGQDPAPQKTVLHCSFCGKSQHDVRCLVAGPAVYICDECVALCDDIVEDEKIQSLLKADEESGHQGYPATTEHLRAKVHRGVGVLRGTLHTCRGALSPRIEPDLANACGARWRTAGGGSFGVARLRSIEGQDGRRPSRTRAGHRTQAQGI
jgi:hypothetical protein